MIRIIGSIIGGKRRDFLLLTRPIKSGETEMKISICNELFKGWPIEKVFGYAAELGVMTEWKSPRLHYPIPSRRSRPGKGTLSGGPLKRMGLRLLGFTGSWPNPKVSPSITRMKSSGSKLRNISWPSSTSARISEEGSHPWLRPSEKGSGPIKVSGRHGNGPVKLRGLS